MTRFLLFAVFTAVAWGQNVQEIIKHGEEVFTKSCGGYCHGVKGGMGGGAPRLAGRGFDEAYISSTISRGVSGTAMPGFAATLDRADLTAVAAYVASLNGIANPSLGPAMGRPAIIAPKLSPEGARGRALFFDALRSFGRCATCHESGGMGLPVAGAISKIPDNAQALKALATPNVGTAMLGGDSLPALVVSQGRQRVVFYDLTSAPPVERSVDPGDVKLEKLSAWKHSDYIGSYSDAELDSILAYLRAVSN